MRIKFDESLVLATAQKKTPIILDVANRERHHFEQTISTLAQNTVALSETRRCENLKTLKENMLLLSEVNTLRRDFKNSQMRADSMREMIEEIEAGVDVNDVEGELLAHGEQRRSMHLESHDPSYVLSKRMNEIPPKMKQKSEMFPSLVK